MSGADRSSKTALVVNNSLGMLNIAGVVLAAHGYRVLAANNGATALAVLGTAPALDMLISNIRMAGLPDGVHLAMLVTAHFPLAQIIFITGERSAAFRSCLRFAPSPFVTKIASNQYIAKRDRRPFFA